MNWNSRVATFDLRMSVLSLFLSIASLLYFRLDAGKIELRVEEWTTTALADDLTCEVKVALVLCNSDFDSNGTISDRQINQTLTLLKSILITTEECVHVLLISNHKSNFDWINKEIFENPEKSWDIRFSRRLQLEFVPLAYPDGTSWLRDLYRPCATFRLFLPEVLPQLDAVVYMDTDFIFLRNIHDLWAEMGKFSPAALAGMVARAVRNETRTDLKRRKLLGMESSGNPEFNSGIILMNLTRMRAEEWSRKIIAVAKGYPNQLGFGDQDIMNIYFNEVQEEVHELSCDWNFRYFSCDPNHITCQNLASGGISALHGNSLSFVENRIEPLFHSVFNSFMNIPLTTTFDLQELLEGLKVGIEGEKNKTKSSLCAKMPQFEEYLLRRLEKRMK